MSFESKLLTAAREVTGDDSITDVAEFQPKGTAGTAFAGAVAGSVVGGDVGAGGLGAAAGALGGKIAVGLGRDLPPALCVAVSPDSVYLLGQRTKYSFKHLDPLAKLDRHQLGVEVHQRATVRTVVLEDLATGHRFPLEVSRLNFYHGKALVELLMLSDQHQDEEGPTDAEVEEANALADAAVAEEEKAAADANA